VKLNTIPGIDRPIKNGEEIKFHTGTSEETGKIFLLEEGNLGARQTGIATVALRNPVAAAALDRFIIRRPSPAFTCAGGEILSVSHTSRRPKKKKAARHLQVYQDFFRNVDLTSREGLARRIEYYLCTEKKTGASANEISIGTLIPREGVDECLAGMSAKIMTLNTGGKAQGDFVVHVDAYRECLEDVEKRIQHAKTEDKALSLTVSELRKNFHWPPALWNKILDDLNRGDLVTVDRNKLILKGAASQFNEADQRIVDRILEIYEETGFQSPRPTELPDRIQAPQSKVDKLLEHLCNELKLVRLSRNVILNYRHFKQAQDVVVNTIREKGVINSADFKYMIDSTRKYALAILDFLDLRRVTVNLPNHDRKLAQDYEKNLL
jgi:selenocysteine-specific elongation factor